MAYPRQARGYRYPYKLCNLQEYITWHIMHSYYSLSILIASSMREVWLFCIRCSPVVFGKVTHCFLAKRRPCRLIVCQCCLLCSRRCTDVDGLSFPVLVTNLCCESARRHLVDPFVYAMVVVVSDLHSNFVVTYGSIVSCSTILTNNVP